VYICTVCNVCMYVYVCVYVSVYVCMYYVLYVVYICMYSYVLVFNECIYMCMCVSVFGIVKELQPGRSCFRSLTDKKSLSCLGTFSPALRPTKLHIESIPDFVLRRQSGRDVMLTAQLHLVPRLKMSEALLTRMLPLDTFMASSPVREKKKTPYLLVELTNQWKNSHAALSGDSAQICVHFCLLQVMKVAKV